MKLKLQKQTATRVTYASMNQQISVYAPSGWLNR